MEQIDYSSFRRHFDEVFKNNANSVSYQLFEVTDLFQTIAAIYEFGRKNSETAFHNPILFRIIESALLYGICVQIRRLADGTQKHEISLYKLVKEIESNCKRWTRREFVEWDGLPYDSNELREAYEAEVRQIISENIKKGQSAGWLPIGKHEEVERRHNVFDLFCGTSPSSREPNDKWNIKFARHLSRLLQDSAKDVLDYSNQHLVHRVHVPGRKSEFNVSLKKIEGALFAVWRCFTIVNAIFYDSHTTPDIVHSLDLMDKSSIPLVASAAESEFLKTYERIKDNMETEVSRFSFTWREDFLTANT